MTSSWVFSQKPKNLQLGQSWSDPGFVAPLWLGSIRARGSIASIGTVGTRGRFKQGNPQEPMKARIRRKGLEHGPASLDKNNSGPRISKILEVSPTPFPCVREERGKKRERERQDFDRRIKSGLRLLTRSAQKFLAISPKRTSARALSLTAKKECHHDGLAFAGNTAHAIATT